MAAAEVVEPATKKRKTQWGTPISLKKAGTTGKEVSAYLGADEKRAEFFEKLGEDFNGIGVLESGKNRGARVEEARQKHSLWLGGIPSAQVVGETYDKLVNTDGLVKELQKNLTKGLDGGGKSVDEGSAHGGGSTHIQKMSENLIEMITSYQMWKGRKDGE